MADTAHLDCALKILKVAAKRLDSLEIQVPAINQVQLDSTSAEYYMLRANLVRTPCHDQLKTSANQSD